MAQQETLRRPPVCHPDPMQRAEMDVGPLAAFSALPGKAGGLSRSRQLSGLALCIVGLPLLTVLLVSLEGSAAREMALLLYLLAVVIVSVVGGLIPGLLSAVEGFLLANWFLTPPFRTLNVGEPAALADLVVFLLAAAIVSVTVEVGTRNRANAERHRLEAGMVSRLSSAEMSGVGVDEILAQIQHLYRMRTVVLVDRRASAEPLAQSGAPPSGEPVLSVPASEALTLLAYGDPPFAEDRMMLRALAGAAGRAWETQRLAREATRAEQLAETDRVRSALLAAVGHDLRTPIAGIKTAASGLRQADVTWQPEEEAELLETIEESADRLASLVDNLLAMSRIQAGALSVQLQPVSIDEVVSRALISLKATAVELDIPEDLPTVLGDEVLLERVIANLVDNARRFTPPDGAVRITAREATRGGERRPVVQVRVIDHGPGIPAEQWDEMFRPFQRLGDRTPGGTGLGLAIARGLTEAMQGSVTPSETPGGGLTMQVDLPVMP